VEEAPTYATKAMIDAEQPEAPEAFPVFAVGEEIVLKGYPFIVCGLNASSIKLRPVPPEGEHSARKAMRRMTA